MKPAEPDDLFARFAKWMASKFLDYAEKLPRFRAGTIHELQELRKFQRRDSQREYKHTRPPEGTELEFTSFTLVEVFQVEDFKVLRDGLLELLPDLRVDDFRNFKQSIAYHAQSITSGMQGPLGFIHTKNNKVAARLNISSSEIESLSFRLHKILSGMFILSVTANLTLEASHKLQELQSKEYLPAAHFKKLFPFPLRLYGILGWRQTTSRIEMEKEIARWLGEIKIGVSRLMKEFVPGFFSSSGKGSLPCMELFLLKGVSGDPVAFEEWRKQSRGWWSSLGFNFYYNYHVSKTLLFALTNTDFNSYSYRLVLLLDEFNKTKHEGYADRQSLLYYTLMDYHSALILLTSVLGILNVLKKNLEDLRQLIFKRLKSSLPFVISPIFKLHSRIQGEIIVSDRLSMDLEQEREYIKYQISSLKELRLIYPKLFSGQSLSDSMMEWINFEADLVKKQFELIRETADNFLLAKNTQTMFWLTVFVALATLVVTVAEWNGFIGAIKDFINFLMNLL